MGKSRRHGRLRVDVGIKVSGLGKGEGWCVAVQMGGMSRTACTQAFHSEPYFVGLNKEPVQYYAHSVHYQA